MSWIQTGSTITFLPYTLEEALRGVSEAGFENVEIGAVKDFLEHLDPDDLSPEVIDHTKELLARYNLRVVSLSGHAPIHTELGFTRLASVIRAADELGCVVVNTFTGDAETPEERATFTENVRSLADDAQSRGLRLCIETDSNMLPTAEEGVRLLDEIGHPWVLMNYDPGNVVYYTGASPEQDIKHALGRLGHVHLKDKRGGKGTLDFPALGEGDIDIPSILADIAGSGFDGPVSMEVEFTDYNWPAWDECLEAAKRGKTYWDGLGIG